MVEEGCGRQGLGEKDLVILSTAGEARSQMLVLFMVFRSVEGVAGFDSFAHFTSIHKAHKAHKAHEPGSPPVWLFEGL